MRLERIAIAALLTIVSMGGCSSSSSSGGSISVTLVDAPSPGFLEVNVDVQKVEIASSGGWIELGRPDLVVNLLSLTGGTVATLVKDAAIAEGHYGQLRLVLGRRNTVKLLDGTVADLTVPSGQQSGVKMVVSFDVQAGTTKDVYIDFDAHRSIFVHATGGSARYILRPTIRACDRLETGSIAGVLTDADTLAPLPHVWVLAETIGGGIGQVIRAVQTDASGRYTLDLLPRDIPLRVVSQPVVSAGEVAPASYAARFSGLLTVTAAAPVQAFDASFHRASATGDVTGSFLPPPTANDADSIEVRALMMSDGSTFELVLRHASDATAPAGQFAFSLLPVGATPSQYTLAAARRTIDADGNVFLVMAERPVVVPPGAVVTQDIDFAAAP